MRKQLLTLAAALAISGGTFSVSAAEMQTGTVCQSTDEEYLAPFCTWNNYSASQSLYPASALAEATDNVGTFTIEKVSFPVVSQLPSSGTATMSLYLAIYDGLSLPSPLSTSNFTKVATATYDWSNTDIDPFDPAITFNLDEYFVVKEGQYLVVGVEYAGTNTDDLIKFQSCRPVAGAGYQMRYARGSSPVPVSLENQEYVGDEGFVPGMKIGWEPGEVSKPSTGGNNMQTGTVCQSTDEEYLAPFCTWNNYSASQSLYPASALAEATDNVGTFTIEKVSFPVVSQLPSSGTATMSLYLAIYDGLSLPSPLSTSNFTKVATATYDWSTLNDNPDYDPFDPAITFNLDEYFVVKEGQYLVVGVEYAGTNTDDLIKFQSCRPVAGAGYQMRYARGSSPVPVSLENQEYVGDEGFVPGMKIGWEPGEVTAGGGGDQPVEVVDLAAAALTAPEVAMYTDKAYEFIVAVANHGTAVTDEYTVEIVNTANDAVLASVENPMRVYPAVDANVKMELTFAEAGTYTLAARVVKEGDENADNDLCEPIQVTVNALDYKAVAVSGNAAPEVGVEQTYTVTVANEGTSELSGYTVELYLVREGLADKLVGTVTDAPVIAAGENTTVDFKYTFELAGEYGFKGVVSMDGGEPSETAVFNVAIALDKLSPVINGTVVEWDGSTNDYAGDVLNRNHNHSASQVLYTPSYFEAHERDWQIQSLTFTVAVEEYPSDAWPLKIYLAQTDRTDGYVRGDVQLVPEEDFVLVYDGALPAIPVSTEAQDLTFELQRLFTLENGKGLVVNIELAAQEGKPSIRLASAVTEENYVAYTYTESKNITDFSVYSAYCYASNMLPVLKMAYALEPLPAVVNIAATEIVAPAEDVTVDSEASFRVRFANNGTVDAETFSIELLSIGENNEATVLETYENARTLAAEASGNQVVRYTFTEPGTYKIAARVVVDGDVDESDNTTESVEVVVSQKSGLGNLLAEGSLSYDAVARVLNVNLGACTVTVCDLAGRVMAAYTVDGAAQLPVELAAGLYVVNANGKTVKIRI